MPMNALAKRRSAAIAQRWAGSFGCGLLLGFCLPFSRQAYFGNADPFVEAWPLFLQAGALLGALLVGYVFGRPFVAAAGVYLGLEAYLFAYAVPEYPVSASIALAIHGLLPALLGAWVCVLLQTAVRMRRARATQI